MDIGDKYFYGEEIPQMLAEIRGCCSRIAFWAREAGEKDKAKFEKWKVIGNEYDHTLWPEERYMATIEKAHCIYVSLKSTLDSLLGEEELLLQNDNHRKRPFNA